MPAGNWDACLGALAHGFRARRRAWNGEKSLVAMRLGNQKIGYIIVINKDGTIHGEDCKIQRYMFNDEDKAASDWEMNHFSAEYVDRDAPVFN